MRGGGVRQKEQFHPSHDGSSPKNWRHWGTSSVSPAGLQLKERVGAYSPGDELVRSPSTRLFAKHDPQGILVSEGQCSMAVWWVDRACQDTWSGAKVMPEGLAAVSAALPLDALNPRC